MIVTYYSDTLLEFPFNHYVFSDSIRPFWELVSIIIIGEDEFSDSVKSFFSPIRQIRKIKDESKRLSKADLIICPYHGVRPDIPLEREKYLLFYRYDPSIYFESHYNEHFEPWSLTEKELKDVVDPEEN